MTYENEPNKMIAGVNMKTIDVKNVRLKDSLFKERASVNRKYLLSLDNNALLQNFYIEAGIILPGLSMVENPENSYLHWGWEAPSCQLRGHYLGHWLSAASMYVASNNDFELAAKIKYIVDELERCQKRNGGKWIGSVPEKYFKFLEADDYIWSPQYTLHKTLMGLVDVFVYTNNRKALNIVNNAADWYVDWTNDLIKRKKEYAILKGEAGGMLEIWARMYEITGLDKYLVLADRYGKYLDFERLQNGEDALTDNHTNASIPEAHGAAKMYEVTKDEKWLNIVKLFWDNAITNRGMYITGANNAGEFFVPPHKMGEAISDRTQEFCTMYNMVRLAMYLFNFTKERKYQDYIERAIYNGFLAQNNKFTAMPTYFLPMKQRSKKTWSTKTRNFWCCNGTMVQSQAIYPGLCYSLDEDENTIYVNQFIPTEAAFGIKKNKIQISQRVDMNYLSGALFGEGTQEVSQKSRWSLCINIKSDEEVSVKIRIPAWAQRAAEVYGASISAVSGAMGKILLDGEDALGRIENGYICLTDVFDGKDIHLVFPTMLETEVLEGREDMAGIIEGPIVLAGIGDEASGFMLDADNLGKQLHPFVEHTYNAFPWQQTSYYAKGSLGEVSFIPLYDVVDETYTIYHNLKSE